MNAYALFTTAFFSGWVVGAVMMAAKRLIETAGEE